MRKSLVLSLAGLLLLGAAPGAFAQPQILSFSPSKGLLVWTNPIQGNLSIIERSAGAARAVWEPFFYDWGTNGLITTRIPQGTASQYFYRLAVRTNIPDSSLVMHLSFDTDLLEGTVLDLSGAGNHGIRYSLTNWPAVTGGIDGLQGVYYRQPNSIIQGNESHSYGDYVAVTNLNGIEFLTNGTVSVWAWFDTNSYAATALVDAGYGVSSSTYPLNAANSWTLGRSYTSSVRFVVHLPFGSVYKVIFPDDTIFSGGNSTYATTNWHMYSVSWNADSNQIVGYYDGQAISTNTLDAPFLRIYSPYHWLAVGCSHHEGSPKLDYGLPNGDMYPNNGWMGGKMDDIRIYNRALTGTEVLSLYRSFDKLPPTAPSNLVATATSSSQIVLHWSAAYDLFGISNYVIFRNGAAVGTNARNSLVFFDGDLPPTSTNTYSIQALDASGNPSPLATVTATTLAAGSGVNLIVDDADGLPWVTQQSGVWTFAATLPGFIGPGFLSDEKVNKGKSLVYRPPVPEPGNYGVYMRYPGRADINYLFANNIPVDIVHGGVTNTVIVSEQANFGVWRLLGTYSFAAGTNDYVRVRTDGTSGYVFADAFMFVK